MRDTFSSVARLLVEGTRCPGRNCPARIARRNHSYNCRYIGIFPLESSAIGGRKLAEARFVDISLIEVDISYHTKVAILTSHGAS
jgi:hypothetical protein